MVGVSKLTVKLKIRPRFQSNNNHIVAAIVVNGRTSAQPIKSFKEDIQRWDNHCLADPLFYRSDRIDMVIGVEIFSEVVQPGVRKCGKILGQATTLGWILSGVLNTRDDSKTVLFAITTDIERFWGMEEINGEPERQEDDDICEDLFKRTTVLDENNRFVVKLQFKEERQLGTRGKWRWQGC